MTRRDIAAMRLAYECVRRGYSLRCTWTASQKEGIRPLWLDARASEVGR